MLDRPAPGADRPRDALSDSLSRPRLSIIYGRPTPFRTPRSAHGGSACAAAATIFSTVFLEANRVAPLWASKEKMTNEKSDSGVDYSVTNLGMVRVDARTTIEGFVRHGRSMVPTNRTAGR